MIMCLFCSWLREWKLRADREERRKQTENKQEEDKNGGGQNTGLLFVWTFISKSTDGLFFFQIQTGTVEKRISRMERTCYAIHCLSQDPLGSERLQQSMPVLRNWASRYKP